MDLFEPQKDQNNYGQYKKKGVSTYLFWHLSPFEVYYCEALLKSNSLSHDCLDLAPARELSNITD
jgi:hypothetical protein